MAKYSRIETTDKGCLHMAKRLEERKYLVLLKLVGWDLKKGGVDYNLVDEQGHFLCAIKIIHAKGKKREVLASSIRKTEFEFKERGWSWPPQKKLKNT
jgi:hypothetical protein